MKSERVAILFEIVAFVAFALLSRAAIMLVAWRYAGPISLAIVLAVLTLYLRHRGLSWRNFGFRPLPGSKPKLRLIPQAIATFAAFGLAVAIVLLGGQALDLEFMAQPPQGVEDRWGAIEGNLPLYLLWLAIAWTGAAFGEEMFFRGYLVTRLETLFSGSWVAPLLAVVLAASVFGYGHMYYQGLRGFVTTGAIAIAFGTMFLIFKRNLWPMIVVHGFVDSAIFTARYLGLE